MKGYEGKVGIGGIGEIKAPHPAKRVPKGKVLQGNDLRTGRGGKK